MKKATFTIRTQEGFPELRVNGWILDQPGLLAWNDPQVNAMPWCLVHESSGFLITRGKKREDLIELANRFTASGINWAKVDLDYAPTNFFFWIHDIIVEWLKWMNTKYYFKEEYAQ